MGGDRTPLTGVLTASNVSAIMKVLLIQPPIADFYRTEFREYPLGLLYLAAALEARGHRVSLLDARRTKKPREVPLPTSLSSLTNYYTRENNLYLGFRHFGMPFEEIGDAAAEVDPDIVCISALFTPYTEEVLGVARAVKNRLPHCRIIVGGHHATADAASILNDQAVDVVIRGEGEEILPSAIEGTNSDMACIYRLSDLDAIPFPARHIIDANQYLYRSNPYSMILTSRGCPHRCSFCSVHTMSGHEYRKRDIDSVFAEIEECVSKYGIRAIDFQDDNLLFDTCRIKSLFERLIVKYEGRGIEWLASNGMNVAHIDCELIELMRRLGFRKLDLALGTGDVQSREAWRRPETVEHYERVLGWARKAAIEVTTYVILGFPLQPISEMRATVDYLKTRDTLIAPSIFYNVPGMPCFEDARRFEVIDHHIARRSSAFNNYGVDFTRDDIFNLFREIRNFNLSKR